MAGAWARSSGGCATAWSACAPRPIRTRPGICRPRGLPDGSGEGHDIRGAGRKALTESCILMRAYPSSTTQALRLRRRSFLAGLTVAGGTTTAAVAQQSGLKFAHRRRRRRLRRLWQRLRRRRQMGEPEDRRKARDDPRQPGECPVARSGHGRHRSGVRRDDPGTFQSQGWAANPAQGDNHRLFEPRHVRRAGRQPLSHHQGSQGPARRLERARIGAGAAGTLCDGRTGSQSREGLRGDLH